MGAFVSLHGRAFGFDSETGNIVRNGVSDGVTAASTAANISNRGTTTLGATAAKDYTLDPPTAAGKTKRLVSTNGTTQTVTASGATFLTTAGSTVNKVSMESTGAVLLLESLSTILWAVISKIGTTTFTTA